MHRAGRTHTGILKRKHEPAARTSERRKLPVRAPNPSIRARETARRARALANIDIETTYRRASEKEEERGGERDWGKRIAGKGPPPGGPSGEKDDDGNATGVAREKTEG